MTKYILHGGNTSAKSENNRKFFREVLKNTPDPVNLLIVYFSTEKDKWSKLLRQDKENFQSNSPDKKINFFLANKEKKIFVEQVKEVDVIYLRDGRKILELKNALTKIKNLKKLFKGKTIVGCSAGAYVLAKYFYSLSLDKVIKGLDFIPIKITCHYNENRKRGLKNLRKYGEKLKTYSLKEGKFIILKKGK